MSRERGVLTLAVFLACASPLPAEEWMSPSHRKEFAYLAESGNYNAEKWAALEPEAGDALLRDAAEPAAARYAEVLASYKALAARWDGAGADAGLRAIDQRELAEVRLWLGEEGAVYLAAKKTAVSGLLGRLAAGSPLEQADLAAADAYFTPAFAAQVKAAAKYRSENPVKQTKVRNKKASFGGADRIKSAAGGPETALNKMYDGGGAGAGGGPAVALKGHVPSAQLKTETRQPVSTTVESKAVPVMTGPDKAVKPVPADYAAMSPEAKKIYQVHAAVVDKYKAFSLGAGSARGTLGNMSGYAEQECKGPNDKSFGCGYAKFLANAAFWYAETLPLKKGKGMENQGIPTEGIKVAPHSVAAGEYMRCYDWANTISATAEGAGVSPQFSKREVTDSGFLGLGEHHYVVFIGQGKIYISDPWKNGGKLMVAPDTPANRKKWVDR